MRLRKFFGNADFWRDALRLAVPISVQNLLVSSFALVDTVMVGTLGETALAAVGMAGQWSWLLNLVLFGFNSGAAVFIAQFWGVKDEKNIRKSFGLAVLSALTAGLIFTLIGLLAPQLVLGCFTQDAETAALGASYLRIAAFSYVAICLNNLFGTLLRSTEQPKLPLYATIISVLSNALLNALFIYGLDMGVQGAALATAISAWISPVILFVMSMKRKNILYAPLRSFIGWKKAFVMEFYRISIPVLLNESLWALGTVTYKAFYSNASKDFYAALTIFHSIEGLAFSFFVGMCHACAVMVGKQVGSGDFKQAYRDACRFTAVFPVVSLAVGVLLIIFRPLILMPFGNVEAETLATASMLIFLYALEIPLRNLPYITIVGVFRSGGDTRIGLWFDLGCLWGITLPLVYICAFHTSIPLVWVFLIMLLAEDVIKSSLCIWRLLSKKWIRPVTSESARQKVGADQADSSPV